MLLHFPEWSVAFDCYWCMLACFGKQGESVFLDQPQYYTDSQSLILRGGVFSVILPLHLYQDLSNGLSPGWFPTHSLRKFSFPVFHFPQWQWIFYSALRGQHLWPFPRWLKSCVAQRRRHRVAFCTFLHRLPSRPLFLQRQERLSPISCPPALCLMHLVSPVFLNEFMEKSL